MEAEETIILVFGFIALIGILFLIIGLGLGSNYKKKKILCTASTKGKVTQFKRIIHHHATNPRMHTRQYYPVIEYTANGQVYTKQSSSGTSKPRFAVGQELEILYNPDNPKMFYIAGETIQKTLGKIFIIAGILVIAMGIVGVVASL